MKFFSNILLLLLAFAIFAVNACDDGSCSSDYISLKFDFELIFQSCQATSEQVSNPPPIEQPSTPPVEQVPAVQTSPEVQQQSPPPQQSTGGGGSSSAYASSSSSASSSTTPSGQVVATSNTNTTAYSTGSGTATATATATAYAYAQSWQGADTSSVTDYYSQVSGAFQGANDQMTNFQGSLSDAEAQELLQSLQGIQTQLAATVDVISGLSLNINVLGLLSVGVTLGESVSDLWANVDYFSNQFLAICPYTYQEPVANVCGDLKANVQAACNACDQTCGE